MTNEQVLALARENYDGDGGTEPDEVLFAMLVDVADAYLMELVRISNDDYRRTLAGGAGQSHLNCLLMGLRENLEIDHPELRKEPTVTRTEKNTDLIKLAADIAIRSGVPEQYRDAVAEAALNALETLVYGGRVVCQNTVRTTMGG